MISHTCHGSYSYVNLPHQHNRNVSDSGAAETNSCPVQTPVGGPNDRDDLDGDAE
jgi:hypothetical protein